MPIKTIGNPYKPPRTWREALRKPCIEDYCVEAENGFVCVDLAVGWGSSESSGSRSDPTYSVFCHWDDRLPDAQRFGVTKAHMDSALQSLRAEWYEIFKL
jgi:hypothetical protein